jgi:hypothetical protein
MTLHQVTALPEPYIPAYPPARTLSLYPTHHDALYTSWERNGTSFSARYIYGKTGVLSPTEVIWDPVAQVLYVRGLGAWHHGTPGGLTDEETINVLHFDRYIR